MALEFERQELIELVRRIQSADFQNEDAHDEAVATFASSVVHPRATGLIYYWQEEFDREPTPAEIVDRALAYKPIEL